MLNIKVLCVGKIREKSLKELIEEYEKRISKYAKLEIIELDDDKIPQNASPAIEEQIKISESNKLIEKIKKYPNSNVILLDLKGKQYSSEEFAEKIDNIQTYSSSTIIFVIGGSLGMSQELLSLSNDKICFSKMTFPHQLIRVFLLEQIFRAFKILNNETYHK
ncbi:MAG: 23S rRNA (pseudouridine(1915)-N(3))-methyltransferase RlmH [Clostridia bacterium]|nr:23S rRNA (pseudouridine(1915)-N(3))-methyltransferase RlmH [Clostridia bacterium]